MGTGVSKEYCFLIFILILQSVFTVKVCKHFSDYFSKNSANCWENMDSDYNVTEIIRKWGFQAEEHYLKTPDGHQILIVRSFEKITQSTPVVIGHGIYMNSLGFVDTGNKSLTYVLNRLGYDVWLINFRGTRFSSRHDKFTNHDIAYWKFSFHEMGIYDISETLRLVFKTTQQKSIYIGYSMGSTAGYAFASTFPEKSSTYLKGIISLAPIAYMNNIKSILKYGAPYWPMVKPAVLFIWKGKVLPRKDSVGKFCSKNPTQMFVCESVKVPIFGDDFEQMDPLYRPVTNILNPDTIGINVVAHYDQIINKGKFRQFDYGKFLNLAVYGTIIPPEYNLSNINVPMTLFVGLNDWIATKQNALRICKESTNVKCQVKSIAHRKWNHADFITARDIKPLLNDLIGAEVQEIELHSDKRAMDDFSTNYLK